MGIEIGQTISHYKVLRKLGHGGMGEVYQAHDQKLDRAVALKVLKPEFVADEERRERFLREAHSAAAVTHPYIAPIYDAGEADGTLFIAMEFVEGRTMRALLAGGPLPIPDAERYATEMAEGLAAAHQADLVHRDIKPDNVIVASNGHVKILDFGLAKLVEKRDEATTLSMTAAAPGPTVAGQILGTPAYMSPEQVRGEQVDSRSDVFSFGVTLYEMVTGKAAFHGPTYQDTLAAILKDAAVPSHKLNPEVPSELNRIIIRCLHKKPDDRYNDTRDLVAALRDLQQTSAAQAVVAATSTAKPGSRARSVALVTVAAALALATWTLWPRRVEQGSPEAQPTVLERSNWILVAEFEGPAGDPNLAVAARELTMAALSYSKTVTPLTRAQLAHGLELAMKPDTTTIKGEIARELALRAACAAYIEGRVDRVLSGYSIVLNVIDVEQGTLVTSVSGLAENDEAFISTLDRLGRELREELGEEPRVVRSARPIRDVMTPSLDAYRKYAQGLKLEASRELRPSNRKLMEALALDPDFAAAWARIGVNYNLMGERDSARAAFDQAAKRPNRLGEYERHQLELFDAGVFRYDEAAALRIVDLFIQEHPTLPTPHNNRAVILSNLGRWDEALSAYARNAELSPWGAHPLHVSNHFRLLLGLGRFDEAETVAANLQGRYRDDADLRLAIARLDWHLADSLATRSLIDDNSLWTALVGGAVAALDASRGAVHVADSLLAVVMDEEESYLASSGRVILRIACGRAQLATGMPTFPTRSKTRATILESVWAALYGDSASVHSSLREIRSHPQADQRRYAGDIALLPLWSAASEQRWEEVLRFHDEELERQRNLLNFVTGVVALQWMLGEANAHLGRLQEAAEHFERALAPARFMEWDVFLRAMASSFAHHRLVLLYSKMGRVEDARRHWTVFERTFTTPDPELVPMVEEARRALEEAEAKAAP